MEATLELNCAGLREVALCDFQPAKHKVIFWDEAKVELILSQRKLFQCPAVMLDLGVSPTASYVYKVWVNDAVMVIGSNKWSNELQALELKSPDDADWICCNQVLLRVHTSMFMRE